MAISTYLNPFSKERNFYSDTTNLLQAFRSPHKERFEESAGQETNDVNNQVKGLSRNNTFIASTSRAYRRGVSATSFNIQSRSEDKTFNNDLEKHIKVWSKKGNCEITGRHYRGSAERTLVDEFAVKSGGFILRHHYNNEWEHGYKFEIIPLNLIDNTKRDVSNGLFNGIKVNKFGEIKSIWIFEDFKKKSSKEVPYEELTLAVNLWADATQYSGVAPVAPVLEALAYVDNYKSSEMKGAKQRADNPIFIKTPYFTELMKADQAENRTKLTFDSIKELFSLRRLDNKTNVEGFTYIAETEEIQETGKAVDSIYEPMYKNETRGASSSVGLTSSSTVGESSSSYNEALRGVQSEEREFKGIFEDIIELAWHEVIAERLLMALVLKGLVSAPNFWEDPGYYQHIVFMRKEIDHIDPVKTAKAITENLVNGSTTMIDVLAAKGIDYQEHIKKLVDYELEKKRAFEDAGLVYIQTGLESVITDEDLEDEDLEEEKSNKEEVIK